MQFEPIDMPFEGLTLVEPKMHVGLLNGSQDPPVTPTGRSNFGVVRPIEKRRESLLRGTQQR